MPLHIEPHGLLSSTFELSDDGRPVGRVQLARVRSTGHVEWEGLALEVRPEKLLSGTYVMERAGRAVARAERQGWLRPSYTVRGEDRVLTLRPAGVLMSRFRVLHGDHEIGSIARSSMFGRAAEAEFRENVPAPLQAFVVFLALSRWRKQRQAAAGG